MFKSLKERQLRVAKKYGLNERVARSLKPPLLDQLQACKTEAARRLLLGVSVRKPESTSQ
jgi:hypothetical protein